MHSTLREILRRWGEPLASIADKVLAGERISDVECLFLFERAPLSAVVALASLKRRERHGQLAYYIKNFHVEPTNYCVFSCKFCSYSRSLRERNATDAWLYSKEDILQLIDHHMHDGGAREVHIVGGVYPKYDLDFYCELFSEIKARYPTLHIKALTAVELDYIFRKARVSIRRGLMLLREAGLDSIPGGGAEIFHEEVRKQICSDKCSGERWLEIHLEAHQLGIPTGSTMLYGHIEDYYHRVHHMSLLRALQDTTGGFRVFIPLKFHNKNNEMSHLPMSPVVDDVRTFAIARIYFDNIDHIKAYWPMLGRTLAQQMLTLAADDIDGTIEDTTRIYSLAGAQEQHPVMSVAEIRELVEEVGLRAVERDGWYNPVGCQECIAEG